MADSIQTLSTTRYVPPGAYIAQLIVPGGADLGDESRVVCYVGRGSRLATVKNRPLRRSFISDEQLDFSGPPFKATLAYTSNGDQQVARVFEDVTGAEVPRSKWSFVKVEGQYTQVLMNPEVYDANKQYVIDYQSNSRLVKDLLPFDGVRSLVAVGDAQDKPQYTEFVQFFLDSTLTAPAVDTDNTNATNSVETPTAASGNAGYGAMSQNAGSAYTHNYTRYYTVTTASSPAVGAGAQSTWTIAIPAGGGDVSTAVTDGTTISIDDGVNDAVVITLGAAADVTLSGRTQTQVATDIATFINDLNQTTSPLLFTATSAVGTVTITHRLLGNRGDVVSANDVDITCTNSVAGNGRTATFSWTAAPMSAGNSALPPVPGSGGTTPTFAIDEDDTASLAGIDLEHGVKLNLGWSALVTITDYANIVDGESVTVHDGSTYKIFAFWSTPGSAVAGTTGVDRDTSAASVATALRSAINSSGLGVTATNPTATTVLIVRTTPGALSVTESVVDADAVVVTSRNFVAGDSWTFNGLGKAMFEIDSRMSNTNQFDTVEDPVKTANGYVLIKAIAQADLVDGETFTVYDGTNTAVVFEIDKVGDGVTTGRIQVDVSGASTAADVATIIKTAINAVTEGLAVSAAISSTNTAWVELTADSVDPGTITVSDTVADTDFTVQSCTGSVAIGSMADLDLTYNTNYTLVCTAIDRTTPGSYTATFGWDEHGDRINIADTFTVTQGVTSSLTQTLNQGVVLTFAFGADNFSVGDTWTIAAKAQRELYTAKDTRNYTLTVDSVTTTNPIPGTVRGSINGTYVTDTPEGSFGTFTVGADSYAESVTLHQNGHFTLPGNVLLAARNLFKGPVTAAAGNRHTAADAHTFTASLDNTINWSLSERTSDTIAQTSIKTDVSGGITGTPNTKYVVLSKTPTSITTVKKSPSAVAVSYVWVTGTKYVYFVADPASAVAVEYEWRTAEPTPGNIYYLSGNYLRPTSVYNTPVLVGSLEQGRTLLGPPEKTNDLYIMNEIAWKNNIPAVYFVQALDSDDDGELTTVDYATAVAAAEPPSRITDICVLNAYTNLSDTLEHLDKTNDPLRRRERLGWIGLPTGTLVGDVDSDGSLVATAKNTLAVVGDSPSHGTRILPGSVEAEFSLQLQDRSVVTVGLDGSFIAGALAAMQASGGPRYTILRKPIYGFKSITTHGDFEAEDNKQLGAAGCIPIVNIGTDAVPIYVPMEDITTDTYAADFKNINGMTQKQFVRRFVRSEIERKLIGLTPDNPEEGMAMVRGAIASALTTLRGRGLLAAWLDDDGVPRRFNSETDILVEIDSSDPTTYNFNYCYYIANTIKRLFGLEAVNTNDFGRGRPQ